VVNLPDGWEPAKFKRGKKGLLLWERLQARPVPRLMAAC
jgi:hypothetical protein